MSAPEQTLSQPPRVFISYSHDNSEHCNRVLDLAQQLRRDGINAELDQFHQEELEHWPRWCEEQLRPEKSDFVLCVCTREYKRRVESPVAADVGKGVFWEGTQIYNDLYAERNERFVPVLLYENANETDIPSVLAGYNRFKLTAFGLDDLQSQYSRLYRLLTRQPLTAMAEVGTPRKLTPLVQEERRTDFIPLIERLLSDTQKILSILQNRPPPASSTQRPHNLPPWMEPEYFVGRGTELQSLTNGLTRSAQNPVPQPQVIYGGGGTGKSRLAIQVAWLLYLEGKCDMAFFVSADTHAALDTKLAELDGRSFLNLYKGLEPPKELEVRKKNVIDALRVQADRWVLVLDNADSKEGCDGVKQLLRTLAGGRFMVTSRRENWPTATARKLKVFNSGEAVSCLRSWYWKTSPTNEELGDFRRLAEELGYLPLGLHLASIYMKSNTFTPGRYLEKWKQEHQKLLDYVGGDEGPDRSLMAAFKVSYKQLSHAAVLLLHQLAWLAPLPFPRSVVENSQFVSDAIGADVCDVLADLQTLSFIERDEYSISLHGLVLGCVQAVMSEMARRVSLSSASEWLSEALPKTEYNPAGWRLWEQLAPHCQTLLDHLRDQALEPRAARIMKEFALWLKNRADYAEAEPLFRRALAINEKSFGPDHPEVAQSLDDLAFLLKDTNRHVEAEPLFRRALAINEKSLATSLTNLAFLLKDTERHADAEPLFRQALTITESCGPDHPNVATALNNLAFLLRARKLLKDAEPLHQRALVIIEKSFRQDHPEVATALNNVAELYRAQGRYAEARPLYQRALAIREKALGLEHPGVVQSLNNLALLLKDTSHHAEAEPLFRRALAINEKSFGSNHPEVAQSLNNLAFLLKDTNHHAEAEPLFRRALAIVEMSLGPDHPNAATGRNNLAEVLRTMTPHC